MQRGDQVVVFLARLVVAKHTALQGIRDNLLGDAARGGGPRGLRGDLEHVVSRTGVAAGVGGDPRQRGIFDSHLEVSETPLPIRKGPPQQGYDLLFAQRIQDVNATTREQGRVYLERWILRRRSDQPDIATLHVGQESILLGAIEAMNLIHEDDRARAILPGALRV